MLRGNVIAQIIGVLGTIYLAKIYGENAYGIFGFFVSIVGISSILSTLQLEKCIVISVEKNQNLFWFNFVLLSIPIVSFLFFLVFYFSSFFITIENLDVHMLLLLLLGSIFFSFNIAHSNFFTHQKKFKIQSNSKVFITLSNLVFQILLYYYFEIFGLIIGFVSTQLLVSSYFFYQNKEYIGISHIQSIKKHLIVRKEIITYLLPSNLLNSLAINLMPILILAYFDTEKAGVYFLSIKILGIPLFLISASLSEVYFKKASELYQQKREDLYALTKQIIKVNVMIMLVFAILINTILIYFLELFFENSWTNLRVYILLLSILMLARVSFNPISSLIVVLNKNLEGLLFNIYLFIANIIAIYIGYLYNEILITIVCITVLGSLGYLILLTHFLKHLKFITKQNV